MAKNNEDEKYAYLNQLNTEQLEELLRADIDSPVSGDIDVIFHILEVIEKREEEHPTGRLADEKKAWIEFQKYYNTLEGEGLSLYPPHFFEDEQDQTGIRKETPSLTDVRMVSSQRLHWKGFVAAAVLVILFMGVVVAEATGIDVLGALGQWTEETFHFVSTGEKADSGADRNAIRIPAHTVYYDAIENALKQCGITENLTPTWYPDGFKISDPEVLSDSLGDTVNCPFQHNNGANFSIWIMRYNSAADLALYNFEKDATLVENYTHDEKTFYIMSNLDNTTATWSDGRSLLMSISGSISVEDIKAIIDSMGG